MTESASGTRKKVAKRVRRSVDEARREPESVETGDFIDYSITLEIQPQPGQKAWIKWGVTSQVRHGETTQDAVQRVAKFVEDGLDQRIADQSQ